MPERIQRQRTKGWRMPDNTVYVGRPTKFGNPFQVGKFMYLTGPKTGQMASASDVVDMFRNKLTRTPDAVEVIRAELAGKNLACWCPLAKPCHADVLLEIANEATNG
jgi:hypothetical protein